MKTMIIGGGKVGTFLANYLHETGGHEVKLVELRRDELPRLYEEIGEDHWNPPASARWMWLLQLPEPMKLTW
jgi:2-polyprenyl-6-methoxyphenol hydroxylase-like FAD-dependent oxidoreductase